MVAIAAVALACVAPAAPALAQHLGDHTATHAISHGAGGGGTNRAPVLHLEGDDYNGTTWVARVGPTGTIPVGCGSPAAAGSANGHAGVDFISTEADLLSFGDIGGAGNWTAQFVEDNPCNDGASAAPCDHRQYRARSIVVQDSNELILSFASNGTPNNAHVGYFDGVKGGDTQTTVDGHHVFTGLNWRGVGNRVPARKRLSVITYVLSPASSKLFRDGELLGSNTITYTQRALSALVLGGTYAAGCTVPDTTGYDGRLYQVKIWRGALSDSQAVAEQRAAMARFGITTEDPSAGTSPDDIFGSALVRWWDMSKIYNTEVDANGAVQAIANRMNTAAGVCEKYNTGPTFEADDTNDHATAQIFTTPTRQGCRDDTAATTITSGGVATGAVSMWAVMQQCGATSSTGGEVMSFGAEAATNPRSTARFKSTATTSVQSQNLDNAGTSRSAADTTHDPGTGVILVVWDQDEAADIPHVNFSGNATSGTGVNLGATTLNTFVLGGARRNGAYTSNQEMCVRVFSAGIVNRLLTAQEQIDLRTWATAVYGGA